MGKKVKKERKAIKVPRRTVSRLTKSRAREMANSTLSDVLSVGKAIQYQDAFTIKMKKELGRMPTAGEVEMFFDAIILEINRFKKRAEKSRSES